MWVSVWSMGDVMVVLPGLEQLESHVEQDAQDDDTDAHGQRLSVPRLRCLVRVADLQAVDQPPQLFIGLAGFEPCGHHCSDGAGDKGEDGAVERFLQRTTEGND